MSKNLEKSIALDKEILSDAFGEDFFVAPQEDKDEDFKYLLTLLKEKKNDNKKDKCK